MNHCAATTSPGRGSARWNLFVDTGGTFTDCLGLDPSGAAHRVKVLSSGVVRAKVERVVNERAIELKPMRGVEPHLLVGWRAAHAGSGEYRTIVAVHPATWRIELDAPLAPPEAAKTGSVPIFGESAPSGHGRDARATALVDLSTGEEAPVLGFRLMSGTPVGSLLPAVSMRLATTRGTNALLERKVARTALFVTQGFGDLLAIGDQTRPELFAIDIVKPEPICERTIEVDERIDATGGVLRSVDLASAEPRAREALASGITSAAIALMNSYVNPAHEQLLAKRLRAMGFAHVSVSSELAPLIKIVPRAQTSVVDAALGPIVSAYVDQVQASLGGSELRMMTSAGGLVRASEFLAKDGLLSGPAGGVIGALAVARQSGFAKVIGFDMGGTSTDVARMDGEPEYLGEHMVAGVRVFAPALAVETVAAGGGSICDFEQEVLTVGPASAGANPGPACYGVGGPLTLTDVNVLLGRLAPGMFEIPIDREAAEAALEVVRAKIAARTGAKPERAALLHGFLDVANQRMAEGIARVSVRFGYDPADYALVAFGGAGAQHACAIADSLGMKTVIMPAEASLLSALGLAHAAVERFAQRQMLERFDACAARLDEVFDELRSEAAAQLAHEVDARNAHVRRFVDLRLAGQETALTVECDKLSTLARQFRAAYGAMYGHFPGDKPIEVVAARVLVKVQGEEGERLDAALRQRPEARTVDGRELRPGERVESGAIIAGASTCGVVGEGWSGQVDSTGAIVLSKARCVDASAAQDHARSSLVKETLLANRLSLIAETMGEQLRRTAVSTNVKERLDFSCAILDARGQLVMGAAHIPVHLGALGHCVRAVIDRWRESGREFRTGDVVVTNHPGMGGSHLPDVTVVTPVFAREVENSHADRLARGKAEGGGELIGFTASRAHHAEIGGARPGSMPAGARRLAEEGVIIEPMLLIEAGVERFDEVEKLLRGGAFPSRAVADNMADLRAAVSANHRGALLLAQLADETGIEEFRSHLERIMARSERLVREAIARRLVSQKESVGRKAAFAARDVMDDSSVIAARIELSGGGVTIDFTGTSPVHAGNLNATPGIVHSAVMYVMRLLVDEPVPLNDGLMRAVYVVLPRCMLNPEFGEDPRDPRKLPAVVGGNTETSQRIVDVLLRGFGLGACSQGTMNNVLFGTGAWAYYETICGGSGATPHSDGASAVHTHMTNTRMTDPEVLEKRSPVRLERFAIRRGSGGAGRHRGGNGVVREMTFLAPVQLSVLTQRRTSGPPGLDGGAAGAAGRQRLIRANGAIEELRSVDERDVQPGDRLIVETPGGGGWGGAHDVARASALR